MRRLQYVWKVLHGLSDGWDGWQYGLSNRWRRSVGDEDKVPALGGLRRYGGTPHPSVLPSGRCPCPRLQRHAYAPCLRQCRCLLLPMSTCAAPCSLPIGEMCYCVRRLCRACICAASLADRGVLCGTVTVSSPKAPQGPPGTLAPTSSTVIPPVPEPPTPSFYFWVKPACAISAILLLPCKYRFAHPRHLISKLELFIPNSIVRSSKPSWRLWPTTSV